MSRARETCENLSKLSNVTRIDVEYLEETKCMKLRLGLSFER